MLVTYKVPTERFEILSMELRMYYGTAIDRELTQVKSQYPPYICQSFGHIKFTFERESSLLILPPDSIYHDNYRHIDMPLLS